MHTLLTASFSCPVVTTADGGSGVPTSSASIEWTTFIVLSFPGSTTLGKEEKKGLQV